MESFLGLPDPENDVFPIIRYFAIYLFVYLFIFIYVRGRARVYQSTQSNRPNGFSVEEIR